jgi:hypothetical protein
MAAKQDQIVWTIFGIFWAANAVLLVALFATGAAPQASVGAVVVSAVGAGLSGLWIVVQHRAIGWLTYYERIILRLEEEYLRLPPDLALSAYLNLATRRETVGQVGIRPLVKRSGAVVAGLWLGALAWYICRLTNACL